MIKYNFKTIKCKNGANSVKNTVTKTLEIKISVERKNDKMYDQFIQRVPL